MMLSNTRADMEALFYRARSPSHFTATGDVYPDGSEGSVSAVVLTPAAAAATATLRDGGPTGDIVMVLTAPANGASVPARFPRGFIFHDGLHLTLAGAGASVTVVGTSSP